MTAPPRPQAGPSRTYHFPRFESRHLPNGMRILVARVTKLPVVTVMMVAEAGAMAEPSGLEGIARLTAGALLEGSARHTGVELTERLEGLGASVELSADWDVSLASMTVLRTRLREAFGLLAEVVGEPSFPEREIERLKSERLAELLQTRAEPRTLASEMFSRFLYVQDSRYALPEAGSEKSVASLSAESTRSFYGARYRAGGLTMILAGDVHMDEAEKYALEFFGGWANAEPADTTIRVTAARETRAVHIVDKNDAPQSELRIGHVGIPRSHPDFYDVLVMNAVLGGLFSSRINLNLREEHGYTYGASSTFDWRRQSGPFVVSTAVRSDVTDAAVREILKEIDRIRAEVIPLDELTLASSFLEGVFPIKYETTNAIAHALANLVIYDLPDDYFEKYRARIREVSPDRVLQAAQRHLHPENLQVVVVGAASSIREPLERLRTGPVTVYDSEDSALT